ncbi:MAG: TonB-dependent receptor [Acidobacteriota bacterium]
MKKQLVWMIVLGALAVFTFNGYLLAQVGTEGSILGVVTDPSGAVIAGAEVTVTNLGTNSTKSVTTDAAGRFQVLALPRGNYSVSVSAAGFKTWALAKTELTLGELKRLTPVLTLGEVSETVEVTGTVELVQTEKGSLESTIQAKQITDLPLNGRNPVELVRLVPGMRYLGQGGAERGISVTGFGQRDDAAEFQLDGLNANAGMDEGGFGIPNVDTIQEFNVETSNFSAEHGRNPLQVLAVTKSGTNDFHGTLWEFHRNHKLDARNTFALTKPKLIRNQYGATAGGPIIKDKTFFFGSYEGTKIRQSWIYNSTVVPPSFLDGDFSSLSRPIIDPETGSPFPGNRIPTSRFSSASTFFFPYLLQPNSADGRFRQIAPAPTDIHEVTARFDHYISDKQRIYGRYIINDFSADTPGYKPQDVIQNNSTKQQSLGVNYSYSLSPTLLLTLGANYLRSLNRFVMNLPSDRNLTLEAGIQGIPTEGREAFVGLPNISFSGYTGIFAPWGTPGRNWMEVRAGKAGINKIWSSHTVNAGYELNDRSNYGRHGSFAPRGNFSFSGQYTGNGFADYLLGLLSSAGRNYPIQTFGLANSPYSGFYIQDYWKVSSNLTLNLGLRYDYWHAKAYVRGQGASFDFSRGQAITAVDKNGNVDLTAQPVSPFLAEATKGLWIPGSQVGAPPGLFQPRGVVSPRLGFAWRPQGGSSFVIRGGYGLFPSLFRGNASGDAIVAPPFWGYEVADFSSLSMQRWETAFPANPTEFGFQNLAGPRIDIKPPKTHEWNLSIQKELPWHSAVTLSYVGNRINGVVASSERNAPTVGPHVNLQADRPYPAFASIALFDNVGKSWYNSFQLKVERRFSDGLSYMASYAFSKHLIDGGGSGHLWDGPVPYAPEGYNRGRSDYDRTHILALNTVYELPFGKGRKYAGNIPPVVNAILGGWQISGIYNFTSGSPLSFMVWQGGLGNGYSTRANLVGNLKVSNPNAGRWFNPDALAAAPLYTFGNSGYNILDGPGSHVLDTSLAKNFYVTEKKFFQFRWEMFNMPNHVNLSNPETGVGFPTTGMIFRAGSARSMQLGLKFIY